LFFQKIKKNESSETEIYNCDISDELKLDYLKAVVDNADDPQFADDVLGDCRKTDMKAENIGLFTAARLWLTRVGLHWNVSDMSGLTIAKFLNRILGLESVKQNLIFSVFFRIFEELVDAAKKNGTFDEGIRTISGSINLGSGQGEEVGTDAEGYDIYHQRLTVDKGISWTKAMEMYFEVMAEEAKTPQDAGHIGVSFHRTQNTRGKQYVVLAVDTDLSTLGIFRPTGKGMNMMRSVFNTVYKSIDLEDAKPLWESIFNDREPLQFNVNITTLRFANLNRIIFM